MRGRWLYVAKCAPPDYRDKAMMALMDLSPGGTAYGLTQDCTVSMLASNASCPRCHQLTLAWTRSLVNGLHRALSSLRLLPPHLPSAKLTLA